MERVEQHASFGGRQEVWRHASAVLGCEMKFGIYLPEQALRGEACPVLYFLAGLTCTEQNFITKANAQEHAARHGIVVVAPDTSPRGADVADDEGYDLGQGAGFYLNATQQPWAAHYRMQDYVAEELPELVERQFPVTGQRAICGHSMGGHGALTLALKYPQRYRSVSAFAPIVAPSQVPWGRKALPRYLGDDPAAWADYDACELVRRQTFGGTILIDQGEADPFLEAQLKPERFDQACAEAGQPLLLRRHVGYDHSYWFVTSFIDDHLRHHAGALGLL